MMRFKTIAAVAVFLASCSSEPLPIEYGFDQCTFCEMTIVDNTHASKLVSTKGKTYKFDAIECMIRYSNRNKDIEFEQNFVADFYNPGNLILAEKAIFLISPQIASPMGANLSATTKERAFSEFKNDAEAEILTWPELKIRYN